MIRSESAANLLVMVSRLLSSCMRESSLIYPVSVVPRLAQGFASAAASAYTFVAAFFLRFLREVPPALIIAGLRAITAEFPES